MNHDSSSSFILSDLVLQVLEHSSHVFTLRSLIAMCPTEGLAQLKTECYIPSMSIFCVPCNGSV